jgi:hypothetical protein
VLGGLLEELGIVAMSLGGGVDPTSAGEALNEGALALDGASGSFQPLPEPPPMLVMQMTAIKNNTPAATVLQDKG